MRRKPTRAQLDAARSLHRAFRDESPRGVKHVSIAIPKAGMDMGQLDTFEYTTRQGGKTVSYRHVFRAGSRPRIIVGRTPGVIILTGRFRVTGRGVVDLDERGREIDD